MATKEHCVYCFDSIIAHFDGKRPAPPAFSNHEYPLFVTWTKEKKPGDYRLRGCIGTFASQKIHIGLQEYAVTSAFNDSRFEPLTKDEVPSLACAVSLLHKFEAAANVWDWKVQILQIGLHGIQIAFEDPDTGRKRRATYLPEVASEQGWTAEETLDSLIKKAGYNGRVNETLLKSIQLERYQSSKEKLTYMEYMQLRK